MDIYLFMQFGFGLILFEIYNRYRYNSIQRHQQNFSIQLWVALLDYYILVKCQGLVNISPNWMYTMYMTNEEKKTKHKDHFYLFNFLICYKWPTEKQHGKSSICSEVHCSPLKYCTLKCTANKTINNNPKTSELKGLCCGLSLVYTSHFVDKCTGPVLLPQVFWQLCTSCHVLKQLWNKLRDITYNLNSQETELEC